MDRRILVAIVEMELQLARVDWPSLALGVNLSPSHFAHLFSRETHLSPSRYLHALRMERARLLLARTCLSVKEVMAQVGIADASHFSRDFRKYHGVTPSAARQFVPRHPSAFLAAHLDRLQAARARLGDIPVSANE